MIHHRNINMERRRIGHIALQASVLIMFWLAELTLQTKLLRRRDVPRKIQRQVSVETLDGINLIEQLQQPPAVEKVFKGLQLDID